VRLDVAVDEVRGVDRGELVEELEADRDGVRGRRAAVLLEPFAQGAARREVGDEEDRAVLERVDFADGEDRPGADFQRSRECANSAAWPVFSKRAPGKTWSSSASPPPVRCTSNVVAMPPWRLGPLIV